MTIEKFDQMIEKVETLSEGETPFTAGYYPSIEELENLEVENNIEKYLSLLIYFSNNPYGGDPEIGIREDYRDMVKYTKSMLYRFSSELD